MTPEQYRQLIEDISARAARIHDHLYRTGSIATGATQAPAKVQKLVAQAATKLTQEWRKGESIQQQQVLEFLPLIWKLDGVDLDEPPPDNPEQMLLSDWPNCDAMREMVAKHLVIGMMDVPFTQENIQVYFNSAMMPIWSVWVYMKSRELSDPNVFNIHDALFEKLMNTDLDNVLASDVQLPLPGLYVSLPPGVAYIRHQKTGMHELSLIGTAAGYDHFGERGIFTVLYGEPNRRSTDVGDDATQILYTDLGGEANHVKALIEGSIREGRERMEAHGIRPQVEKDFLELYGQRFDQGEGIMLMHRLLINFTLYINTQARDIAPEKPNQPKLVEVLRGDAKARRTKIRVSKRRSKGAKKHRESRKPQFYEWETGANVQRLQRTMTAKDILVRGHFRRQPYGPGRQYRKIIWIEPFIRLPSDGEGPPPGHEYEVEPNL